MSLDQQRLQDYLLHIIEAVQRVHRYTKDIEKTDFLEDNLVHDAVMRNISVIEEACKKINSRYKGFAELHQEIPLIQAYGMRKVVAHGHFKEGLEAIWETIESDLPGLKQQAQGVLQQLTKPLHT